MDFAKPHVCEESVATKSNIRYIPPRALQDGETKTLDDMVIDAANLSAQELLLGPSTSTATITNSNWIDARYYPDRISPQSNIIQPHQLVVIFESFDHLSFVYATPHAIFSNRNGHFHHDDFIGKPFGCKVRSRNQRGYGFMYLLKPTPELWSRSLPHRTQIIHELDASMIVYYLNLRPNMIVCESGTGSGALSHFILRTIAPRGHLHTYDFNEHRVRTARVEFAKHGLEHLVTVHYKDVCGKAVPTPTAASTNEASTNSTETTADTANSGGGGGFDVPGQSVDAILLDLPNPWLAVPYAAYVLKPACRIATYSPCVEQSQRTILALKKAGFHSITTQEFRRREYYVDEIEVEGPPTEKRPRTETHNVSGYTASGSKTQSSHGYGDVDTGAEADNEESQASECEVSLATEDTPHGSDEAMRTMTPTAVAGTSAPVCAQGAMSTTATPASPQKASQQQPPPPPRKRVLAARPFTSMRGHTAFLTFATAGNRLQPYPNSNSSNTNAQQQQRGKSIPTDKTDE